MNAPTAMQAWRASAYSSVAATETIAIPKIQKHCFFTEHDLGLAPLDQFCFPSPSPRSGHPLAGPSPCPGKVWNRLADRPRNRFEMRGIAVESVEITTNQQGSHTCANRLSSSPSFPPLLPAACRTLHRVAQLVLLRVSSSRMQPTATCLPGQSSAALRALQPAASKSASGPATDPDLTAFGRLNSSTRTIRANRPGGPLLFAA